MVQTAGVLSGNAFLLVCVGSAQLGWLFPVVLAMSLGCMLWAKGQHVPPKPRTFVEHSREHWHCAALPARVCYET